MAKFEMKKLISIFLMLLLVVAHAEDAHPPSSSNSKNSKGGVVCVGKCAFQCKRFIKEVALYPGCVAGCKLLKCNKVLSKDVHSCATKCSISKTMKDNTKIDIPRINLITNSCLEGCKKN
ncbi:unnamed protein product [Lathyrus oleraceus]